MEHSKSVIDVPKLSHSFIHLYLGFASLGQPGVCLLLINNRTQSRLAKISENVVCGGLLTSKHSEISLKNALIVSLKHYSKLPNRCQDTRQV